jgi:hypothetical protein
MGPKPDSHTGPATGWVALLMSLGLCAAGLADARPPSTGPTHADGEYRRVGRAYSLDSGDHVYTEVHRERIARGRLLRDDVRYLDTAGRTFATKRLDYSRSLSTPTLRFDDARTGRFEAVTPVRGGFEVLRRAGDGEAIEREVLAKDDVDAVDEGLHTRLRANFHRLIRDQDVDVSLTYPSQLDEFDLRFERRSVVQRGARRLLTLAFEPASILLRPFMSTATLTYDLSDGRVLEYRGISNIRDRDGDVHSVRLVYEPTTLVVPKI